MEKPLDERIENEINSLKNQQNFLTRCFAVAGLIGLCFVLFGFYINSLEETEMQQIVNPQLDWTIIGSWFIFCAYCLIALFKFIVYHHIWKLKKERLSIQRHYAYRYVHPVEDNVALFINEKVLKELEAKGF